MPNKIKSTSLLFIAALSIGELFFGSYCNFRSPSVGGILPLGIWAVFLAIANWSWGYQKMFSSGVWFFKRDEDAKLLPNAKHVFYFLYGAHIIFSLLFSVWLISYGFYWAILFPAVKIGLILWANHQLFYSE